MSSRCARRLLCCALLALAAGACARPEPLPPERRAFAGIAAAAVPFVETREVDIGTPAARSALWSGWGPDEKSARETFVWGGGERSLLVFEVAEPRELKVQLRGWAFPFSDGLGQEIRFELNGREFARRSLPEETTTLEVRLPEKDLSRGENRLELIYARHDTTPGASPWAAAWDGVRIDGGGEPPATPRFDAAAETLELAGGSGLSWRGELPAGAFLAWDRAELVSGARLEIARRSGGDAESIVVGEGPGQLRLSAAAAEATPGSPRHLHELSFTATGDGKARLVGLRLQVAAATPAAQTAASAAAAPPAPRRPNLIVYLVDTLRADRLGCYGYTRPTSPRIDEFARRAALFREARAQAPWTRPAVATVLTGLPPWAHGVEERGSVLPDAVDTAAERLRAAGYATALFTTNANVAARFGFDQGWDEFQAIFDRASGSRGVRRHVRSERIEESVVDWLDRNVSRGAGGASSGAGAPAAGTAERPFFLFVHTLDPHDPYRPEERFRLALAPDVDMESACCASSAALARLTAESPAEAARRAAAAGQLYDAEIAENDASFGALLDELDRRGLADSTAVLFTSDHGEEFLDHGGWKHGFTLYEEMLRIPLLLRLPGAATGRVVEGTTAEQIDVVPTLLDLAGVAGDPKLPGRSLVPLAAAAETAAPDWPALLARLTPLHRTSLARLVRAGVILESAKQDGWKLVHRRGEWTPPLGEPPWMLFDLPSDLVERHDLAFAERDERIFLGRELDLALVRGSAGVAAQTTPIDPELDKALKALGYI